MALSFDPEGSVCTKTTSEDLLWIRGCHLYSVILHKFITHVIDGTDPKVIATGDLEHDWSDLKCNQENVFLLVAFNPCNSNEKRGVY